MPFPPGPRRPATYQSVRLWHDPVGFQQATRERYGEPFTVRMHPVGPLVVVSDPESVHHVLTGDTETFQAGRANGRILPILDGESVLVADGEKHRHRRHLLMLFIPFGQRGPPCRHRGRRNGTGDARLAGRPASSLSFRACAISPSK